MIYGIVVILALIGIIMSVISIHNGGSKTLGIVGIVLSIVFSPIGFIIGVVALKKSKG